MQASSEALDESVTQLITRLWRAMDQRQHAQVTKLLTDDCRWFRDGEWVVGKPAINASLETRPVRHLVRHILSNFIVLSEMSAFRVKYYMAAYVGVAGASDAPLVAEAPRALADMETLCLRQNGELRIAEIDMRVTFLR